jgi:hypothetical protein
MFSGELFVVTVIFFSTTTCNRIKSLSGRLRRLLNSKSATFLTTYAKWMLPVHFHLCFTGGIPLAVGREFSPVQYIWRDFPETVCPFAEKIDRRL